MNVYAKYDQYDSEDYLCYRTKPTGELLCGYCHQPYEPISYGLYNETMTVCSKCGEVSFPYYED